MKNLIDLLKDEKEIYAKKEINHEHDYFHKNAIPEILALNKQYRAEHPEDKVGYNSNIVDYITEKYNIPTDIRDILQTQVFLSQRDLENEKAQEYEKKMLADGWIKMTEDIVKKAYTEKKKLEVNATTSYDWLTSKITETFKPFVNHENECYLMKLRARRKGCPLSRFQNAFCKIV